MTFTAPQSVVPTGDERELLLRFLHRQREEVVSTTVGLTDGQARWTPDGRLTSIVGILNHLTRVEWRWIEARYLDAPIPTGGEEFAVAADDTLAGVIDRYWQRGRRTDAQVRAAPGLEVPCLGCLGDPPTAAHTVYGLDQPVDLRWVLLHLIEETAHHAGHADSTREMLDGTTMR